MDPIRSVRRSVGRIRGRNDGPKSRRLTFAYDDQGIRLIRHTDRAKPAPPTDPLEGFPSDRSVVAEVRSVTGDPIYRHAIPDALPTDVEVFEPDGSMHREPHTFENGVFTVVVPLDDAADHVVLDAGPEVQITQFEVSPEARQTNDRVQLGRFPLEAGPEAEAR